MTNVYLASNCADAAPGWPCDKEIEDLKDAFTRAATDDERKAIAEKIQLRAMETVPYVPIAQSNIAAYRSSLTGVLHSPIALYWNVEKHGSRDDAGLCRPPPRRGGARCPGGGGVRVPAAAAHPGRPGRGDRRRFATPQQIEQVRAALGLDRPIYEQFIIWAGQLAHGDLGRSVISNVAVTTLIAQRIGPTLSLAITTMLFASALAIPLGIVAAAWVGTIIDRCVMVVAVLAFSLPVFCTGYALVLVFAIAWQVLPVQGYVQPFRRAWSVPQPHRASQHHPRPCLHGVLARVTRSAMLEVLNQDYIRTARAKACRAARSCSCMRSKCCRADRDHVWSRLRSAGGGNGDHRERLRHSRSGRLTVDSILTDDYPVIQGLILFFAAVYIALNLAIDLSYSLFDPRIRSD